MLEEDDSLEQREEMIHGIEPRRSKAKSEYLPRRTERMIKKVPLRKESSGGLTKIATTNTMVIVAVAFFTVSCFYFYVGRASSRFRASGPSTRTSHSAEMTVLTSSANTTALPPASQPSCAKTSTSASLQPIRSNASSSSREMIDNRNWKECKSSSKTLD